MILELRSIDVWSVVKIIFLVMFVLHLLLGIGGYFIIILGVNFVSALLNVTMYTDEAMLPGFFGFPIGLFIITMISSGASLIYASLGALMALLYNAFARWGGGVIVNASESKESRKPKLIVKSRPDPEEENRKE